MGNVTASKSYGRVESDRDSAFSSDMSKTLTGSYLATGRYCIRTTKSTTGTSTSSPSYNSISYSHRLAFPRSISGCVDFVRKMRFEMKSSQQSGINTSNTLRESGHVVKTKFILFHCNLTDRKITVSRDYNNRPLVDAIISQAIRGMIQNGRETVVSSENVYPTES
ncbi:hypothetical protein V1477_010112 [Vespula maculifrons]|uniref:Uncharacterized protein n=1 Tax=Vespula maculifrons TaxID=7453 RepID=A0ABD2CBP6_VESMC